MLPDKFRIAMFNRIGTGPYFEPIKIYKSDVEWLIVERLGTSGEHLLISDASTQQEGNRRHAPSDLAENNTLFGILIEQAPDGSEATFIFTRNLFGSQKVKGNFFPADGYARIETSPHGIRLSVAGRHSHETVSGPSGPVTKHLPEPIPANAGSALNWHFDAVMRPWSGQVLDEPAHLELI